MRYGKSNARAVELHMVDGGARGYCGKSAPVKVDADEASFKIASREWRVCSACQTVKADRERAERAMADNFMMLDTATPSGGPAAVELGLFGMDEAMGRANTSDAPEQSAPVDDAPVADAALVPCTTVAGVLVTRAAADELDGRTVDDVREITDHQGVTIGWSVAVRTTTALHGGTVIRYHFVGIDGRYVAKGYKAHGPVARWARAASVEDRTMPIDDVVGVEAVMAAGVPLVDALVPSATAVADEPGEESTVPVAVPDVVSDPATIEVWGDEGGACPGVETPAATVPAPAHFPLAWLLRCGEAVRELHRRTWVVTLVDGVQYHVRMHTFTQEFVFVVRSGDGNGPTVGNASEWSEALRLIRAHAAKQRPAEQHQDADTAEIPVREGEAAAGRDPEVSDAPTQRELDMQPVAVFIASMDTAPPRARVLWWMTRHAAMRLCSDSRTSWSRSSLHWTATIDPDERDRDWEFVKDRRPEETAALFDELFITPMTWEQVQERKPGTCDPVRWCDHAWPCGRNLEEWRAKQPKSKTQLRRERQEAARAAKAAPVMKQPEQTDEPTEHEHAANWIEMRADLACGGTTYHAVCDCGHEVGAWTARQPSISTGTLKKPLGIADAPNDTGNSFADRSGFDRTGPWRVVDESTKRAPIELRPDGERPDFVPTCGPLCGHSVICRPRPAAPAAPVEGDQEEPKSDDQDDQVPAPAQAVDGAVTADIVISHTRADGTLIEGSAKGDGVWEAVKPWFRYSRNVGIYIRGSRDKGADRRKIEAAAEAIRALGKSVAVVIDEDTRRTFAEAEAERVERAEARAERYAERAGRAAAASDEMWDRHNAIGERFFMGQPILIGHHSEKRARRDQERVWDLARRSAKEQKRADYWAGRAVAAEHYEAHRNNPGRTLRRIAKLEAQLRRVEKWQRGESAGGYTRAVTPETVAELSRAHQEITEELAYWRVVVAEAEKSGAKLWGPQDFARGDFVRYLGKWYEVIRVNKKSLTVPAIITDGAVVTVEDAKRYGWTDRADYSEVTDRMSAALMAARLNGDTAAPESGHGSEQSAQQGIQAHICAPVSPVRLAVPVAELAPVADGDPQAFGAVGTVRPALAAAPVRLALEAAPGGPAADEEPEAGTDGALLAEEADLLAGLDAMLTAEADRWDALTLF